MKYDLSTIGSALVDFTFNIEKGFETKLADQNIPKGSMTLIEREDQEALINELLEMNIPLDKACGGSGTNTTVAASMFGANCHMSCIVSNDDHGKFYIEDLLSNKVSHSNPPVSSSLASGRCLVMVSQDAERTMCTNLGINSELSSDDINEEIIKKSNFLFLEGYLVASPNGVEVFKRALKVAKENDTKVSVSLSDPNIVNAFRREIHSLLKIQCDLVFCNEEEALAYAETDNLEESFEALKEISSNFLITQGSSGCIGFDGNNHIDIPGHKVKAIDSNGAGDMFAGAVLSCLCQGNSLEEGAKFGCYAASKVVSTVGPRLSIEGYKEIKSNYS
jgi:sugar/nucleoside kinase (ribokinase family)